MLDVHRLRLLRELASRGTLAAVAEALGYSPSLVSHQLAQLEREAGTTLLERVGRRVRLTHAAEVLVRHADQVLTQLEEAEADLAALDDGRTGRLRVAMFGSAAHTLLIPALIGLREVAPTVEVRVEVSDPEVALARLGAHEVDLVLTEEYPNRPLLRGRDLHREHLADDPIRLATPRSGAAPESLAAAADALWVVEPPGTRARAWTDAVCRSAGFEPHVGFETTDLQLHLALVEQGLAVGLLPDLASNGYHAGIRLRTLPNHPARAVVSAVRSGSRHHPHVVALRQVLHLAVRPHLTT